MIAAIRTVSRETVLLPVHAWRLVSRHLPPRCRYEPSCSAYCIHAVRQRGVLPGLLLAAWRILRCNPWSSGGWDPVKPAPDGGFRRFRRGGADPARSSTAHRLGSRR